MSRPASPARAFTIIEMVIVLTVLGLIVGVTAPRFVNSSARAQAINAIRGLVDSLKAQRAETIRSMAVSRLYLVSGISDSGSIRLVESDDPEATGDSLVAMLTERGRVIEPFRLLGVWNGVALAPPPDQSARSGSWEIRTILVEPTGRVAMDSHRTSLALVVPHGDDTIWRIEFDPISGVPAVRSDIAQRSR